MGGKPIIAFPNPASDKVYFLIDGDQGGDVTLDIFNFNGDIISTVTASIGDGRGQTVSWDCSRVVPGIYLARLTHSKVFLIKVAVVR
jgi:hypothetical protein